MWSNMKFYFKSLQALAEQAGAFVDDIQFPKKGEGKSIIADRYPRGLQARKWNERDEDVAMNMSRSMNTVASVSSLPTA